MAESLQKAATEAIQGTSQMTRYRALETMEQESYNPVRELIQLAKDIKLNRETRQKQDTNNILPIDPDLEVKIHMKLLEYYSAAPKKQMDLNVQQDHLITVLPVSYAHMYADKDIEACRPKLLDVTPRQTVLEEAIDCVDTPERPSTPYSDPQSGDLYS